MKKLLSWPVLIGVVVVVAATVVVTFVSRLGGFLPVLVERDSSPKNFILLARQHLGAYHKVAPIISEVEKWARANGEPCMLTFGEYLDDPKKTDEDRLRSRVGCLIPYKEALRQLEQPLTKAPDLKVEELNMNDTIVATFQGSPSIAPLKVYPKVFETMRDLELEPAGPFLEVYEVIGPTEGRTKYYFPVQSTRR